MLARRLQRLPPPFPPRMEDTFRVRLHLPSAPGSGAARCQRLRASSRRYHRPTGQIQQPGRTQDWIKLGGKVTDTAETPKVADDSILTPTPDKTGDAGEGPAGLAPPPPPKALSWIEALRKVVQKAFTADVEAKVKGIIAKHSTLKNYEVLFLFDDDPIVSYHSDRL